MGTFAELFVEEGHGVRENEKEKFIEQARKVLYYGGMMSFRRTDLYRRRRKTLGFICRDIRRQTKVIVLQTRLPRVGY